jgi:hypothetical protein
VIALLAVPILIQVLFNSALAYGLNRAVGESHKIACLSALIGASNFFELAVAAAISLFGFHSAAALATGARPGRCTLDRRRVGRSYARPPRPHQSADRHHPVGRNALSAVGSGVGYSPAAPARPFAKEDGEVMIDSQGRRVT